MSDYLFLAWRYLQCNRWTAAVLVAAMTLILFLPAGLMVVVDDAAVHFRARSRSTPLVVGPRGSELELVLGTLYFDDPGPAVMRQSQLDRVRGMGDSLVVPLHSGLRAGETPVVGTSEDYFKLRGLALSSGAIPEIPGECLVGARVAQSRRLQIDDKVPLSPGKAFSLGDAPLRLRVAGILRPTETPDDDVMFVNLKTIWIAQGLGHGHSAGAKHGTTAAKEYTDITAENVGRFHFHGDPSRFPLTAIIVRPDDAKTRAVLLGEFLSPDDPAQIVRPDEVMDSLLAKVVMVRSYVILTVMMVSTVTLAVIALVVMLSIRLRQRELATMTKMGCSRWAIFAILGSQIAILVVVSLSLASVFTLVAASYGQELVRAFLV